MNRNSKVLVASLVIVGALATTSSQSAIALTPGAVKAGLAVCAAVDKTEAFATAFSNRKKSSNAAAEKAKTIAAMGVLKGDLLSVASAYNAALRADLSFQSWQGALSTVLSFNGGNGEAVGAAASTIHGYCAKLKK